MQGFLAVTTTLGVVFWEWQELRRVGGSGGGSGCPCNIWRHRLSLSRCRLSAIAIGRQQTLFYLPAGARCAAVVLDGGNWGLGLWQHINRALGLCASSLLRTCTAHQDLRQQFPCRLGCDYQPSPFLVYFTVMQLLSYDVIWWYDMIWYVMIWYGMVWYDMIWYDMIWYDDMIWYGIILTLPQMQLLSSFTSRWCNCSTVMWYDMLWYDMLWYDMVCYGMIWYDMMIWYDDMIWYDMVSY